MAKTDIGVMQLLRTKLNDFGRTLGVKLPYDEIDRKGMTNAQAHDAVERHNACLDYARAQCIKSAADKEAEEAKARLISLGVLGNWDNLVAGSSYVTYDTAQLSVTVKVNNGGEGDIDKVAFSNEVAKMFSAKDYDKIMQLVRKTTKHKAGARIVTVALKESK